MRIISKLWKWITALAVVGIVLMLLTPLLTSQLLEQEAIKDKLIAFVRTATNADLAFQSAQLTILPSPHITVIQAEFSEGAQFNVKAAAAHFYPRLSPLFKGQFEINRVSLESPEYLLQLPEITEPSRTSDVSGGLDDVHQH